MLDMNFIPIPSLPLLLSSLSSSLPPLSLPPSLLLFLSFSPFLLLSLCFSLSTSLPPSLQSLNLCFKVVHVEQQRIKRRVKRKYSSPSDAQWPAQWYLVSDNQSPNSLCCMHFLFHLLAIGTLLLLSFHLPM